MRDTVEYQILIGCNDSQLKKEVVTIEELIERLTCLFECEKINFSIIRATGGYCNNEWYVTENSLCINIIGEANFDIIKFSKSISMFMNQKHILIVKNVLEEKFI